MKKLILGALIVFSFTACQKTEPKEFIETPDAPTLPLSDWEIPAGLNDINTNYRSAFVKDDLLYVISHDSYIAIDQTNVIIKNEKFSTPLDPIGNIYTRHSYDFIVVIDNQQILIKHLASGAEKYLNEKSTDMNGARVMLSKYNNLYFNSGWGNDADSVNHAFHLRYVNNNIILDTLADLLYSDYASNGNRYQIMLSDLEMVVYDDLNKTYNKVNNLVNTPFLPIQEIDNNRSILIVKNRNTEVMQMHNIENGVIISTQDIMNESNYSDWMQVYYLSGDLLFFTGSNQAILQSFNLSTKEFTYYPNKIPNEYARQIIEYNDRLYLISTAGIMFKPFVYE